MFTRAYVPAWIVLCVVLIGGAMADRQSRIIHEQRVRSDVQEAASLIRARLEGTINADVQLVLGLVSMVSTNLDLTQEDFSALAERTVGDRASIRNLGIAPDLVVTMVHPYPKNKAVIGLDYRESPTRRAAVARMRESGQMVLAGPIDLIVGGQGFVGRFPIFTGPKDAPEFWGLISAVFDVAHVYSSAGLSSEDLSLTLALRGKDGMGAEGAVFYGSMETFEDDPILMDIVLPVGRWQLAAIPEHGWTAAARFAWVNRVLLVIIGLSVVVPTFLMCRASALRAIIIEQLQAHEHRLKDQSEELKQLSTIAESASDSIVLSDASGRIRWVNAAFSEITGYTQEEAIGRRPSELLNGPETDQETIERIADHLARGERLRTEILNYTKTEQKVWIETYLVPVRDADGVVTHVAAIERDITAAKQNEMELARAKDLAERADRAKSEFIANMSHEIRTPMNGIMGMAEVLAESDIPEDAKNYVRIVHQSAQALLQIINDILDLSRLEAGKFEISERDFNLRECVDGAVGLVRAAALEKGLAIDVLVDEAMPDIVCADDGRLRQILLNLLGNAVKFTSEGMVSLRVRAEGKGPHRLIFDVEDTGIGMSEDQVALIFDRFSQADAGITRKFGGTGLGLSIARRLAELMGGSISVRSELGVGTCFTAEILVERAVEVVESTAKERFTNRASLEGCRLLLVEDNQTNRFLVHKFLEGLGVEIWDAEDGERALELFEEITPDLVLMDMSMPKLDGLQATQRIRAMDLPQPPIIALTANAFESDRHACEAVGMNAFLSKPLKKSDLIETLVTQQMLNGCSAKVS